MKFIKRLLGIRDKKNMPDNIAGATDVGKVRDGNEDYYLLKPEKNLYIVSDGMGGHNAGELASLSASEVVNNYFTQELIAQIKGDEQKIRDEMIKSLMNAHEKVVEKAKEKPEYKGMGCTVVAALVDDDKLYLCHIGDSRAYICNNTGIKLLTTDHSFVMTYVKAGQMTMEEARVSSEKNQLTQAIGSPSDISPDFNQYTLEDGDRVLLCSDGLWDMLTDQEIYDILNQDKPAKKVCKELIDKANDAGGHDNITVVVITHKSTDAEPDKAASKTRQETKPETTDFETKRITVPLKKTPENKPETKPDNRASETEDDD